MKKKIKLMACQQLAKKRESKGIFKLIFKRKEVINYCQHSSPMELKGECLILIVLHSLVAAVPVVEVEL